MPATKPQTVNLKQAIAVGIFAGLIVVAIVMMLENVQRRRMWNEVDEALSDATDRVHNRQTERMEDEPDETGTDIAAGGPDGPIRGVPGDGLDGAEPPAPRSDQ